MRKLLWRPNAWEDYITWELDRKTRNTINSLIKEILRDLLHESGKPEPLKGNYSGYWSRRINNKDRIVYAFSDEVVTIYATRGHYQEK